jgi:hypothetical protein
MMRRGWRLATSVVVVGCALAGCGSSGGGHDQGPMASGGTGIQQCTPIPRPGTPISDGWLSITDTGSQPLIIDSISLSAPRHGAGLKFLGAGLIAGKHEAGMQSWPPPQRTASAGGYRLAPGQWANVIVGFTAQGNGGSSPGAVVHYHADGTGYVFHSPVSDQLVVGPSC